jgi:F-type H+-transporting ATPase subunit gamma
MAKPRELRRRIKSVESTRKITRTMEMVSTSKLKRAQDRVVAARPYAQALGAVIADLLSPELAERFPLMRRPAPPERGGPRRAALLVITSNRGLAGAFNANLIRAARERDAALKAAGYDVDLYVIGKKAVAYFKFVRRPVALARIDIGDRPTAQHAEELAAPLIAEYEAGRLASLEVVFAHFKSALVTPPEVLRVLPVEPKAGLPLGRQERRMGGALSRRPGGLPDRRASGRSEPAKPRRAPAYLIRPDADALVGALLPQYVKNQVYRALVETAASEHGARRTAMKNATDSAGDMLDLLTRSYNRARQGQITQELSEIVGGAEALKG